MYKMNTEYIIIIAIIIVVVIMGSMLLYLLAKPKKTDSNDSNKTSPFYEPSATSYDIQHDFNDNYTQNNINEKNSQVKNPKEIDLIENTQLTDSEQQSAVTLLTTVKLNKNKSEPIQLNENAMKLIFSLFGNMHTSYENELLMYDNVGKLIVKLQFFPDANKVVINEWHETENLFVASEPWPKNIKFSFTENKIRMNNIMVYEFPDDEYRIYRYMRVDVKGIKEIQLMSINEVKVTAEEVIKRH